ncbi:MAG: acetylxylan esterase [Thermoguttaceae bacterium]
MRCGNIVIFLLALPFAPASSAEAECPPALDPPKMLSEYFEQMSAAKPLVVCSGEKWEAHRRELRDFLLDCAGLKPLPQRVPLDMHQSPALDHPWCTVRRVYYQLWPGVYSSGLLFLPKQWRERPAPAMLCPHGHWSEGNANPEVQKRCINFSRLGFVTFSSTQNHYEDLAVGVSHQTLMIWNNIRALDLLESLPEVDKTRIGVAGESGGGSQTQMLTAVDPRVKAATIVGLTCDFRQIMFPAAAHCACNHFPNIMRRTDQPEISTLGLPAAMQYLTMNDWTKTFEAANFPTIRKLYAAHGIGDRAFCKYFDTEHNYDKTKREWTYWWMERRVRGHSTPYPESEPETKTFAVQTIQKLSTPVPADKGFSRLTGIYRTTRGYKTPAIRTAADWQAYRERMSASLKQLLGEAVALPRKTKAVEGPAAGERDVVIQRAGYPSEGGIVVPAILFKPKAASGKLPIVVILSAGGKDSIAKETGPDSPQVLAGKGALVVLPDLRTYGELFSTGSKDEAGQAQAWERNGIVWGRPVPGMGATDLRGVLDGVVARPDVDPGRITVISRRLGGLAIAALFAAVLDRRITAVDLDFAGCCFEKRNLPLVSCVLQHGDVLQWAALLADRKVVLRNVPAEAGDPAWVADVVFAVGNPAGLQINPSRYEMPFAAKTQQEALAWQARARTRLMELVARQAPRMSVRTAPMDLRLGPPQDKGSYTLDAVSFRGNEAGKRWPGLLAIPKGKGPFPAMLCLHGHGGSAEAVFDPKGIYKGLADRFARGGYVVLAPSFTHQKYAANVLWDLFRCVDILASGPEVDKERIGVGGLSMGGEWTMWIAACDPRLKIAVVSGWMCTTEGVFSVPNCLCWQLPGLVGLMDVCEVHLAIAPRPVVFESAELDPCFPIRFTREGFQRIRSGYKIFGDEGAVVQDTWRAGHEWHGVVAYPTVDKVLGGHAARPN